MAWGRAIRRSGSPSARRCRTCRDRFTHACAATTAPLSGQRVAQLAARGSRAGIQNVLDRLVAQGVVLSQPAGAARLYTLNREHLLAEPLLAMAQARATLLDRLRSSIGAWALPCVHASLFGSVARREASASSDVDVLVVRPPAVDGDDTAWQQQLLSLEDVVRRWTGNRLAWFETTVDGVRTAVDDGEPIVTSWCDDAIPLAGVSLQSLLTGSPA